MTNNTLAKLDHLGLRLEDGFRKVFKSPMLAAPYGPGGLRENDPYHTMKFSGGPITLEERCLNCGCTYGAHSGGDTVAGLGAGQCPNHEGEMDWLPGRGTHFARSGDCTPVMDGAPARNMR